MRQLKILLGLILFVCSLSQMNAAGGWLHTDAGKIKDAGGNVVRLRGVNTYVCLQNEQAKFDGIKALGANVVRLAFWKNAVEGNPAGPCKGAPGLDNLDRAVGYAKNAGLMVILDQHIWAWKVEPAPAKFFTDSAAQESWLSIWRMLIDRYKDNETVIGVDLMNEPWSIRPRPANAQDVWETIAKRAVTELRRRNPKLIYFVSGWGRQTQPMWTDMEFLKQPNTAITDHVYGQRTLDWLRTRYAPYISAGVPVWLGEIGFKPSEASDVVSQLRSYDELDLHYTLFVYGVNSWHSPYDIVDRDYSLTSIGIKYRDHIASSKSSDKAGSAGIRSTCLCSKPQL